MTTPTVSVVIPSYNREDSIVPAIESVLAQSYSDFELIVVDDASTDRTVAAMQSITDPRLKIIAQEHNAGASVARNIGIEAAQGTWIAFHDSDDIWLPDKLERQMALLKTPNAGYVAAYCGMLILEQGAAPETGTYVPADHVTPKEGDIAEMLLWDSFISTQTLIARRTDLLAVGGFDPELPALIDWGCVIRLAQLGPFAFVPDVLVHQFFSANSITKTPGKRLKARLRILETHADLLAQRPRTLAHHHYEIAGALRASGAPQEALPHLAQAVALQPFNLRYRAMRLYLSLRR